MPSLTDLPAELRQQILLHALPATIQIGTPWPREILSLFLTNKLFHHDMLAALPTWSPLHCIRTPASLPIAPQTLRLRTRTLAPRISRISLALFHDTDTARIESTYYWGDAMHATPASPVAGWSQAVARLPPGVDEVLLDVTPAPRGVRDKHPLVWKRFVGGRRAGERFLGGLVEQVAALVRGVEERCGDGMRVELTGWLSVRSAFFVERLGEVLGREVEFLGEWVTGEEARVARIADAVRSLAAKKHMWSGKRRGDENPLVWLRDVVWDRKTGFLFSRLADEGGEAAAVDDLKRIAESRAGQNELVLPPAESLRRAFQHRVAEDLGMKSAGEGEGDDRHVVVRR